jgi:hypothetical protein
MTEQKKAELELLEDTIKHYNISNRAYDGASCTYYDPTTGYKCAIGRLLSKDECEYLKDWGVSTIDDFFHITSCDDGESIVYKSINEKLSKYTEEFLIWLQDLHDSRPNWDDHGLSEFGQKKVDKFKLEYFND